MPRYFFQVQGDNEPVDVDGSDFPDKDCAKSEAVRYVAMLLSECANEIGDGLNWEVKVMDIAGQLVFKFGLCATIVDAV